MMRERILARIAWALVSVWSRTIQWRLLSQSTTRFVPAVARENVIYAFWHGCSFLLLYPHRDSGILIPASESRDGEIMARLLKHFGFDVVRGSSKRKGHKALRGLISGIRRGKNVAIAVDGPRGPLHKVKQGAVFMAGTLNVPLIPVATAAKRFWVLNKSWDKLMIPAPFTRGVVLCGEPIEVNDASDVEIASGQRKLETALHKLMVTAREFTAVSSRRDRHDAHSDPRQESAPWTGAGQRG